MNIAPAADNTFKLVFSRAPHGHLDVAASGRARVENGELYLDYGSNSASIGRAAPGSAEVRTLHRNMIPFYRRHVDGELWVSNDVCQLLVEGETLQIRGLELSLAANNAGRSVFSHLIEGIELLLPSSRYTVEPDDGAVHLRWEDIEFTVRERTTTRDFLDYLVGRYAERYGSVEEVALALTAGFDSRLDLAIMTHLNKRVHGFHYTAGSREGGLAAYVAELAGATFEVFDVAQISGEGWELLKDAGYNTRWDGFFPIGAFMAAGLYGRMHQAHPRAEKLLLNTINGFKGRLYRERNLYDTVISRSEIDLPQASRSRTVELERERRREALERVFARAAEKTGDKDVLADVVYPFIWASEGKCSGRATFLYENGMPRYDGDRCTRELFSALPQAEKEGNAFLTYAIRTLNPKLADASWVTSGTSTLRREYGWLGRIPILKNVLRKKLEDKKPRFDFSHDPQVRQLVQEVRPIGSALANAPHPKGKLALQQIALFLAQCQSRKRVSIDVAQ